MLESLSEITLKDLQLSFDKEPLKKFNPAIDLHPTDWHRFSEELKKFSKRESGYDSFCSLAISTKLLAISAKKDFSITPPPDLFDYYNKELKENRDGGYFFDHEFTNNLYFLKRFAPETFDQIYIEPEDETIILNGYNSSFNKQEFDDAIPAGVTYRFLYPDKTENLKLDDHKLTEFIGYLHSLQKDYQIYSIEAASIKLLYPQLKLPILTSQLFWNKTKETLRRLTQNEDLVKFAYMAESLTILAADDLSITTRGLQLFNYSFNPKHTLPQLPIRRKF